MVYYIQLGLFGKYKLLKLNPCMFITEFIFLELLIIQALVG